jgi:UDP-glucose 4-epimerase
VRVLVTGGAGFIGSHVVDKLLEAGHEPLIFDLRASPYHSPAEVEQLAGDVTDREALLRAARGRDVAIHLAAVANVADVVARPGRAALQCAGNPGGPRGRSRSRLRRVLYGSTTWVYSDCVDRRVDEDTPLATPSHLYTATKLAGELYCKAYRELFGVEYTILRFGIPYGPRAREATVIAALPARAERGEPLTIAGAGKQSRRFVYVEDLAEGVVAALRPEAADRVYNLAGDQAVTVLEIAEAVRSGSATPGSSTPRLEAPTSTAGTFRASARPASSTGRRRLPSRMASAATWSGGGSEPPPARADPSRPTSERAMTCRRAPSRPGCHRIARGRGAGGGWFACDGAPDDAPDPRRVLASFNWLPWLFEAQYFLLARFPPAGWR